MRGIALTAALLMTAACAKMTVSSHARPGLDVTPYRSYDWGPPDGLPTGNARLDTPFFRDHLQGAIEKQMAARGFEQASAPAQADLLIHYHAVIRRRFDVNRVDREYGLCIEEDCRVRVVEYEVGTLVLDVVDARTNQVVWRGWAQTDLHGLLDHEDRMAKRIDEAAMRIVAQFPRPVTRGQQQ